MIPFLRKLLKPILFKTKMTLYVQNDKTNLTTTETDWGRFIVQPSIGTKFEAVRHGMLKETPDLTKATDPHHLKFVKKDFDNITQLSEEINVSGNKIEYYVKQIDVQEYQKAYEESEERKHRNMDLLTKFGPMVAMGIILILGIVTISKMGDIATQSLEGGKVLAQAINHDADVLADRNMINKIMLGLNKSPYGVPEPVDNATAPKTNTGSVPFKLW
jgi:hypothetical protein